MYRRNVRVDITHNRSKNFNDHRGGHEGSFHDRDHDRRVLPKACTHCGSRMHNKCGSGKLLTCQKSFGQVIQMRASLAVMFTKADSFDKRLLQLDQ